MFSAHALKAAVLMAALLPWATSVAGAEPAAAPAVVSPTGAYSMAVLEFDTPAAWQLVGGLRDGKMRVDHGIGITREGGWLELKGDKLTGSFQRPPGALVSKGTPAIATITVEATVANGQITGTCTVGAKSGTVKGRLVTEEQLLKQNPLAKTLSWPGYLGPIGNGVSATPTGVALVDSLADARMVWRSEEPVGNSMGSVNRFMNKWASASGIRTSGQSAAPVLADGRVFMHQRVPAGSDVGKARGSSTMDMAEVKAAGYSEVPWFAQEKLLTQADEVVFAMDASTGKTLWKTTFPLRAPNIQYHKDRGCDRTPAVIGDAFIGIFYNGGLFALDAATGKLRWEAPCGKGHNTALAPAGNVVIAPGVKTGWSGFDVATGKHLWNIAGEVVTHTVTPWRHGEKDFALIPTGKAIDKRTKVYTLSCVDALTGTVAWSMPFNFPDISCGITVYGDYMIAFEGPAEADADVAAGKPAPKAAASQPAPASTAKAPKAAGKAAGGDDGDEEASDGGTLGQVTAYRLSPTGAKKLWSTSLVVHHDCQPIVMHGKYVVAMAAGRGANPHKVIELESGKIVATSKTPGPNNGGYVQAMEDKLFVRHDGTHGRITMTMYQITKDGQMKLLEPIEWAPPIGGGTTSYHHPLMYPYADGRLFMRQVDGVYCWDLRK